ncbi:MAG TPA: DMT family transporter [Actinomycetes bacterium]|nr:DMT family transporter [Actinomycetes bacterium]
MAVFLALLSSLLWGSADFLGGTISRRRMAVLVVVTSQAAGLVGIALVALVAGAFDDPTDYLWWAVGAGLAGMLGLVCFYAALAMGTMGVVSPIAALGVVVPVLVGLARGERPATIQLVGITIAVLGVVLASGPELSGRAGARPLLLAALSALGFGLALLFIAEGARTSTLMTLVTMRVTSVTVLAVALASAARRLARGRLSLDRRDVALVTVTGMADVAANLTFGLASTRGLVSVVAVLGSLYPVVTVLLARVIHAERLGAAQTVGVAGALGGVALIAAG